MIIGIEFLLNGSALGGSPVRLTRVLRPSLLEQKGGLAKRPERQYRVARKFRLPQKEKVTWGDQNLQVFRRKSSFEGQEKRHAWQLAGGPLSRPQ